jgi:uroporphyrinogen decarboxylase
VSEVPLTRQQMTNVIERRGGDIPRVPLLWHKFYNGQTIKKYGEALEALNKSVVDDVVDLHYAAPYNFEAPQGTPAGYKWAIEPKPADWETRGFTSRRVVSSIELVDDFIADIPDPSPAAYYEGARQVVAANSGRYCIGWDPFCLFERAWFLFGMENILCEMALNVPRMNRLLAALVDYHKKVMTGFASAGANGYITTDDMGTQTTLMFSRQLFRQMYLPLYEELISHCHSLGMHFVLHCCGAVTELVDDFIAVGLDVLHPIQPYAMDQRQVAGKYRGRITFLAGIDVQYLLPTGSVQDVVEGTRKLIDTFDHEEGGCILAASNGIMPETPLENIEAWLKTAERYGKQKRTSYRH